MLSQRSSLFSFRYLTLIETRKLKKRALLWVEMAILFILILGFHAAILAALTNPESASIPAEGVAELKKTMMWPLGIGSGLGFINGGELGGLFIAVLVGAFVAQEYSWRSLQLFLSRGVSRGSFLMAKFAAILLAILTLTLTALVAGALATGFYTWMQTDALPWAQIEWLWLWNYTQTVAFTLVPYAALTLLVAVISRSALVAVGVGLGYSLLIENLLVELLSLFSDTFARIARYAPTMLARSITQNAAAEASLQMGMAGMQQPALVEPLQAALLLLLYTLIALGLAWWVFRRQDMS